jgi:hypothetical protein
MVQMGEIPSQNQKNRGDKIFSAKFPSRNAISDLGPKKKEGNYINMALVWNIIILRVHINV